MTQTREQRHVVCKGDALEPGEIRPFKVGKRRLAVMRLPDGSYRAMSDSCPHEGASMGRGAVEKMWTSENVGEHYCSEKQTVAICPWHNFEFDVDTGLTPSVSPRLRIKTYEAHAEGDEVVVYA